jgi:hypothetical protein
MDEEKKKAEVASREKDQVSAPPAREETPSQEETQEAVPETQKPKGTVLLIEDDL